MILTVMNSKNRKTMKKYIYTIVAATAMLASCSQDADVTENVQPQSQAKPITKVGVSTSAESRAVVSSEDNTKVNWESGDQLGVFGEGAEGAVAYTLNGEGGSTSGTFENEKSNITAIQAMMYPYQASAAWDNSESTLTCEIPSVQTATAGSFDKAAAIMYSIGSSTDVILDYAVAFLKVTISETDVHAITVYSSTALSGKVDITSDGVDAAADSLTYVTLQADNENGALAAGDYYIAVKPGELEDLSIAYKYTDHTAKAKQGGSNLTLEAGHVKAIKANFTTGTVHEAVQLWADGPYFATMNVGETTVTGNTQYYKWGATVAGGNQNTGSYDLDHDTAYKIWGTAWRMPTDSQLSALNYDEFSSWNNISSISYGQQSGTYGFTIQGASGYGSIFLPAYDDSNNYSGSAHYWSSTLEYGEPYCAEVSDGSPRVELKNFGRNTDIFVRAVLR